MMKKFISDILLFISTAIVLLIILTLLTGYYAKNKFDISIPQDKNILILGNSHPECAIDDSELSNVFNLAQSGSGYFYDYVKAKKLLQINPQIDTLVLGYSYGDISKDRDSWFTDDYRIKHKMRNHFFLFELEDYTSLLKGNPLSVLIHTPQTIMHNVKVPSYGLKTLGGYKGLTRNKLSEEIEEIKKGTLQTSIGLSIYQTNYLKKIYELCQTKKVKLVLLSTPIHPLKFNNQKYLISNYCNFAIENMPNAILVDDSKFELAEKHYADMTHLNFKGAKLYTDFLKKNTIFNSRNSCTDKPTNKN